jgi:hypothetical protein
VSKDYGLENVKAIWTAVFNKREIVAIDFTDGRRVEIAISPKRKQIAVYIDGELIKGENK